MKGLKIQEEWRLEDGSCPLLITPFLPAVAFFVMTFDFEDVNMGDGYDAFQESCL